MLNIKYITIGICVVMVWPLCSYAQTASPADISNSLNEFADPTGIEQVSLTEAAGGAVEAAYSVMGLIFFVLALYAGIMWMTAQGQEDRISKARNILVAATVGLVIVVGAYGITRFISDAAIGNVSTGGDTASVDEGAIDNQGAIETEPPGCCVYRTSNRRREFAGFITSASDCELTVLNAGTESDRGDGDSDEHDWQYYPDNDVQSAEKCIILETCWERNNTTNRMSCIETTLAE